MEVLYSKIGTRQPSRSDLTVVSTTPASGKLVHRLVSSILLAGVCGCSSSQLHLNASAARAEYITKHGLQVFNQSSKPVPQERIERLTDIAVSVIPGAERLVGWTVKFIDSYMLITGSNSVIVAEGFTYPPTRTVVVSNVFECLADSAFVHELVHVMIGAPHSDRELWESFALFDKDIGDSLCPEWMAGRPDKLRDWMDKRKDPHYFKLRSVEPPGPEEVREYLESLRDEN